MEDESTLEYIKIMMLINRNRHENLDVDCDVKVKVGGRVFPCHRIILISNSQYFQRIFNGSFKETNNDTVSLPSEYIDDESFSKVLDAMYGEPLKIENEDDLISLVVMSSYLQLTNFTNEYKQYVIQNLKEIDLLKLIVLPQLKEYPPIYVIIEVHMPTFLRDELENARNTI